MKFRLTICAMAAGTALFATDVTSDQVYGVLAVTDSSTDTVIGVPWVGLDGSTAITVEKLVGTDTLSTGDKLYVYNSSDGTWYGFTKGSSGWEGTTTISSGSASSGNPSTQTLACGTGVMLQRASTTNPILLCGRYSSSDKTSTIAAGTSEAPVKTLFANAGTEALDLNTANVEGADGDVIIVPQGNGASVQYEYASKTADWGMYTTNTITKTFNGVERTITQKSRTTEGCTIPAGTGAWYVSKGGSPTIKW